MTSISLCMIVKNEEKILARCLDGIADLMDEIIIVDTGSTDRTKEIAAKYTDKIYDFKWVNDFSAARNFAFSKAGCDYIYSADADEVIDEENHEKFRMLKEAMLPEIEIVQMYYTNQLEKNTTYNFDEELRPKLYKRVRSFQWQDQVHETVRIAPVIYDSDIRIKHCPEELHSGRDFAIYKRLIESGAEISPQMQRMYARELFVSGTEEDFKDSYDFFRRHLDSDCDEELIKMDSCVLAKCARLMNDPSIMLLSAARGLAVDEVPSEIVFELGEFYRAQHNYSEAVIWYYNAAFETEALLSSTYGSSFPIIGLHICYVIMGDKENAARYGAMLREINS